VFFQWRQIVIGGPKGVVCLGRLRNFLIASGVSFKE